MVKIAKSSPHTLLNFQWKRGEGEKRTKERNIWKNYQLSKKTPGDHDIIDKREETLKQRRDQLLGSLNMHKNLMNKSHQQVIDVVVVGVGGYGGGCLVQRQCWFLWECRKIWERNETEAGHSRIRRRRKLCSDAPKMFLFWLVTKIVTYKMMVLPHK